VTLKLVAQFGDACNVGREADIVRRKLDVLKRHCETFGRDYDEIVKSAEADVILTEPGEDPARAVARIRALSPVPDFGWPTVIGSPDRIRAHIQSLVDAGIDYVIVYMPRLAHDQEPVHRFAEAIIPHFA
jgi:alkanesulfonate monooxygenase SsuD/methylene tetrahydromethanopterin reductase-like flavin-dependent oxidoreductase (luciferase family)